MTTESGSCHCGRIAFDVETGEGIHEVYDCNCSMCRRRGGLLWFAPRSALVLNTPEADLDTYRFNKERLAHHFCRVCGVAPFSEGVHPKIVSERLGHSRVGITLDLYSHVTPTMQQQAAKTIEALLTAPKTTRIQAGTRARRFARRYGKREAMTARQ